jgi:endonuclease/exonuclease/phosphatase family metal-dependent hydrolase
VVPFRAPAVVSSWRAVLLALATGAMIAIGIARPGDPPPAPKPLRVATFNIETFPKNDAQIEGAFDEIAALGAPAVAVQEIFDPGVFVQAANRRLGPSWRFVHTETMPPGSRYSVHVGVLFDGEQLALVSEAVHGETALGGRQKPTFEVRLRPRAGGAIVQIFIVHFRSGSDGRPTRARQFEALTELLIAARRPGERTMVMGDFNATEDGDRDDLALMAARTGLQLNTEALACSAFWDRRDECPTSRLDHVLSWSRAETVTASGACADGCELRDRCPLYAEEVSDHCPVAVTW